jgi:hypothetical protein
VDLKLYDAQKALQLIARGYELFVKQEPVEEEGERFGSAGE